MPKKLSAGSSSISLSVQEGPVRSCISTAGANVVGYPSWSPDSSAFAVVISWADHSVNATAALQSKIVIRHIHSDMTRSVPGHRSLAATNCIVEVHWAPTTCGLFQLAVTWQETLSHHSYCRHYLLIGAHDECTHLQSSSYPVECRSSNLVAWSPSSSQVATAIGCKLNVGSIDAPPFWESLDVANSSKPIAWAPCGGWILCQQCFVRSDVLGQYVHHGAAGILQGCIALTWGSFGVVAATGHNVYVFNVVQGPCLVQCHKVDLEQSPYGATLTSAPDGSGWMTCLLRLPELGGGLQLLMLNTISGYAHTIHMHAGGTPDDFMALIDLCLTSFQVACVWAQDACSIWVGQLGMPYGRHAPDTIKYRLLRFTDKQ